MAGATPITYLKRKAHLVTQIIGILHKDGILVASDSQNTQGTSRLMNAEKIVMLHCNNGDVVIAQAGSFDKSSAAIQYMREALEGKSIEYREHVAKIAEAAVKKVRMDILNSMQQREYSLDEQNKIFEGPANKFGLLVAYYYKPERTGLEARLLIADEQPYLGTIRLTDRKSVV